jgi:hypothetical protein
VDDHPLLYKGTKCDYKIQSKESWVFITEAKDCESAYNVITNPESDVFDIAFRHKYAALEDKGIYSGEDKLLLNICQIAKLFFTMFTEFLKIKTKKYKLNGLVKKMIWHLTSYYSPR